MLRQRLIFTLLYQDNSFWLSRNFRLQRVGDLRWLKGNYGLQKFSFDLDELIIVDVSRNGEKCSDAFFWHLESIASSTFLPITIGGGIRSLEVASRAFDSGADKLLFNSSLVNAPELISEIASSFGRQAVVGCVDYQQQNGARSVLIEQGQVPTGESVQETISRFRKLPLGELILNSIDRDGTGFGLDLDIIEAIPSDLMLPVIMMGGAGNAAHIRDALRHAGINAVATAHLFNFVGDGLAKCRSELINSGINLSSRSGYA